MNLNGWIDSIKYKLAYRLGIDRRTQLWDLASVEPAKRSPTSSIIQFYSAAPNIGNYMPVFGIRKMLERDTDLWNAHDDDIDWGFINRNYTWAIIGGAGLLHAAFEGFWEQFGAHCELPFVVWGVGACFPDSEDAPGVPLPIARPVLERATLVNLRDDVTAKYYDVESAHVSPCPTVVYLEDRKGSKREGISSLLYSSHTKLVADREQDAISAVLEESSFDFEYTDNIERRLDGLEDIVDRYAQSALVVTTRLHGAIIAYALQVPYIALARDDKVRAFHRLYGNGMLVENVEELRELLKERPQVKVGPIECESVYQFGRRVREQMLSVEKRSAVEAG